MLRLKINKQEYFNETDQTFVFDSFEVELEHSLVSLSKWEAEFEKPFLSDTPKTDEEVRRYIELMLCSESAQETWVDLIETRHIQEIQEYIDSKQTATWFSDSGKHNGSRGREAITAELIYYWMIALNVPFECQYWHLNRLFTLLQVCSKKQEKPKKLSANEAAAQRRALNAERRARFKTSG